MAIGTYRCSNRGHMWWKSGPESRVLSFFLNFAQFFRSFSQFLQRCTKKYTNSQTGQYIINGCDTEENNMTCMQLFDTLYFKSNVITVCLFFSIENLYNYNELDRMSWKASTKQCYLLRTIALASEVSKTRNYLGKEDALNLPYS